MVSVRDKLHSFREDCLILNGTNASMFCLVVADDLSIVLRPAGTTCEDELLSLLASIRQERAIEYSPLG